MIGIRFYFSDFLRTNEKYSSNHILYLMCFSVFICVSIIAIFSVYLYWGITKEMSLDADFVNTVILLPKILFYLVMCYFVYWVLKVLQAAQHYTIDMKEHYENQFSELEEDSEDEK